MEAISSGMGKAFVTGLVRSMEGEKDPRYRARVLLLLLLLLVRNTYSILIRKYIRHLGYISFVFGFGIFVGGGGGG